ncbi:hypothetical protein EDM56_25920 [Brevibacillus fluminis]|uniref:Uncharacterized protein n=1 Tax=Brevibacillus fluminis TaxID=511487 RepID=A0A3M8CZL1_9BACL|nr:hypothetical protein [Brevibacillus fluminis]RNB81163.1 hypothetical protein EDM56_25920 [Brevibacillus fluminis]
MPKRFLPYSLMVVLLLLAAFGFAFRLYTNPINTLLVIGLAAIVLFFVNQYLKTGRFMPNARTPKKPTEKAASKTAKRHSHTPRKQYPFQVIEGQKGKAKNKEKVKDGNFPQ